MAKSKKQLFKDLGALNLVGELPEQFDNIEKLGLKHPKIGDETYGKDSHVYIYLPEGVRYDRLERLLTARGHKINLEYSRANKGQVVDVHVAYFKGHHWDE